MMNNEMYKLVLTQEKIQNFLDWQRSQKRMKNTLQTYAYDLGLLYDWLPEDKEITVERLKQWRTSMVQHGYASRTINSRLSCINSFLAFEGCRDMQILDFEKFEEINVELTREEYGRLLREAKVQNDRRLYLIVKVLGTTGIPVQYLPELSVAEVKTGQVSLYAGEYTIPQALQKELLAYAAMEGRTEGMVFISETGRAVNRTYITWQIKNLGERAGIPEKKATPRRLKQMYQKTRDDLWNQVEELYGRLLQEEESAIQWEYEEN